ncbi:MAG: Holliday junction resolvase RuvX [Chitinophagales bacterium]|nr:Holliday junction resolvase RuvX [Chitinophagales bacterium]
MTRIMAIDYGLKRTGLAVTDPLQIIATALATVETPQLLDYLAQYLAKESVSAFVVGEPKNLDNTASEIAPQVEQLVQKLGAIYPNIPIHRIDERFTSKMAAQTLVQSGLKKKQRQNKALLDQVSAVLILQTYMQLHSAI